MPVGLIETYRERGAAHVSEVRHIAQTDDWLATVVLPMQPMLAEGQTSFSARIDLDPLRGMIETDPFTRTGFITIVDASGHEIFGSARTDLTNHAIVAEAIGLLTAGTRLISVEPYRRPDGEVMLGAFAFPGRSSGLFSWRRGSAMPISRLRRCCGASASG